MSRTLLLGLLLAGCVEPDYWVDDRIGTYQIESLGPRYRTTEVWCQAPAVIPFLERVRALTGFEASEAAHRLKFSDETECKLFKEGYYYCIAPFRPYPWFEPHATRVPDGPKILVLELNSTRINYETGETTPCGERIDALLSGPF